jgi:hypothetical protein
VQAGEVTAMPKRKRDVEDPLKVRSMFASAVAAFVDHRVLFQMAVVCLVVAAVRTFGPDEVARGIDYVVTSVPARLAGRALTDVRELAIGGLKKIDESTRRDEALPIDIPAAEPPIHHAPSAAGAAAGIGTRVDTNPQQGRPVDEKIARMGRSPADAPVARTGAVGATGTADAPETVVWSLVKDEETVQVELHDQRVGGVDLLVFRNGRLWRRERWADRAAARAEADRKRADFEKSGWRRPDANR